MPDPLCIGLPNQSLQPPLDLQEGVLYVRVQFGQHKQAKRDECQPNLVVHGLFACSIEMLNLQVLLHPFEEGLNGPAAAVHLTDFIARQIETVGEQNEKIAL